MLCYDNITLSFHNMCLCMYIVDKEVCWATGVHNRLRRNSAQLPAGGCQLAEVFLVTSHRHDPSWWDGTRQDHTDHRIPLLTLQGGLCLVP